MGGRGHTNATRLGLDTDGDGAADIVILASGDHSGFRQLRAVMLRNQKK
jgi:hypothetical protein